MWFLSLKESLFRHRVSELFILAFNQSVAGSSPARPTKRNEPSVPVCREPVSVPNVATTLDGEVVSARG